LRLKQEEIASVRKQVQVADAKINETRDRHHRRLKRINEKRDRIMEDKNQAEGEVAALKQKRSKLQEESRFVSSKQVEYKGMISGIGEEVDSLGSCIVRLASEDKRREDWLRTVEEERGESTRVQEQLRTAQIAIEKLNAELLELETSVSSNHNNIVSIDLRIPGLEAEKRVAGKI
jgi:chromosome segregation ATPase